MTAIQLVEVESKHKMSCDYEKFVDIVESEGFVYVSSQHEIDVYYSRNDVDYMKTVECLRIRQKGEKAEITYKPPSKPTDRSVICKPETNVLLVNKAQAVEATRLFDAIGLIKLVTVNKKRDTYEKIHGKEKVTIAIDTIESAGNFVEIEVITDEPKKAKELIKMVEKSLSVDKMPIVTKPYRDIVMEGDV